MVCWIAGNSMNQHPLINFLSIQVLGKAVIGPHYVSKQVTMLSTTILALYLFRI